MHILAKYIEDNKIKHADFADKVGISTKHLSQIVNYKTGVSFTLAGTIREATGGVVTADMLLDECANKATA